MRLIEAERKKYRACWSDDRYRQHSPGEMMLRLFRHMVRRRTGTLLDLGCGTGRAGVELERMGFAVTLADFVPEARDDAAYRLPFIKRNAWGRWSPEVYDWIYCCDVLEHMPPEKVGAAMDNIAKHSKQAFLSIHFGKDHFGSVIGHPLHLTVRPYGWWLEELRARAHVVDARDLVGMGVFRLARA